MRDLILFHDNHLLVLNKPAGMLTQPNEGMPPSLACLGKEWIKAAYKKPGNVFLHPVHRIDRPVSGIVLFARTSKALSRLNASLREQKFHKEYLAIVEGEIFADAGSLEHYLKRGEFTTSVVDEEEEDAKKSVLKYTLLKKMVGYSFLKIELVTGRYHQIRAQLAAIGHPILGDKKYGSKQESKTIFLHHALLQFPHPVSQEMVACAAPLPAAWNSFSYLSS